MPSQRSGASATQISGASDLSTGETLTGIPHSDRKQAAAAYAAHNCDPNCGDGDEKVFLRQGVFTP